MLYTCLFLDMNRKSSYESYQLADHHSKVSAKDNRTMQGRFASCSVKALQIRCVPIAAYQKAKKRRRFFHARAVSKSVTNLESHRSLSFLFSRCQPSKRRRLRSRGSPSGVSGRRGRNWKGLLVTCPSFHSHLSADHSILSSHDALSLFSLSLSPSSVFSAGFFFLLLGLLGLRLSAQVIPEVFFWVSCIIFAHLFLTYAISLTS
uniref:Uncharacterized protein n=1 Tax=Setaria viridis TaxID=4556 RepID=A0A4U6V2P3_SETVI|nr:hypothetical protein SEVIR_4G220800v2 [Setaria viridis]